MGGSAWRTRWRPWASSRARLSRGAPSAPHRPRGAEAPRPGAGRRPRSQARGLEAGRVRGTAVAVPPLPRAQWGQVAPTPSSIPLACARQRPRTPIIAGRRTGVKGSALARERVIVPGLSSPGTLVAGPPGLRTSALASEGRPGLSDPAAGFSERRNSPWGKRPPGARPGGPV